MALGLCSGLGSIALAHNWLSTYISILHLQQFLLQAVHPTSSQLLQLPHVSPELVARANERTRGGAGGGALTTIKDFATLPVADVDALLDGYSDVDKKEVVQVAKHWPVVDFVDAKFQGKKFSAG